MATSSVMSPEFRSASMAICLPGIASRVKRAATSATRPAPAVMTTNCTMTRIRKITRPTTRLPPTTTCPNASMTLPASPSVRIRRVEEMFSDSRISVVTSSSAGKTLKSSARRAVSAVSRMTSETVRLTASSRSSSGLGSGSTIMTTTPTIMAGTPRVAPRPPRARTPVAGVLMLRTSRTTRGGCRGAWRRRRSRGPRRRPGTARPGWCRRPRSPCTARGRAACRTGPARRARRRRP